MTVPEVNLKIRDMLNVSESVDACTFPNPPDVAVPVSSVTVESSSAVLVEEFRILMVTVGL